MQICALLSGPNEFAPSLLVPNVSQSLGKLWFGKLAVPEVSQRRLWFRASFEFSFGFKFWAPNWKLATTTKCALKPTSDERRLFAAANE